MKPEMLALRQVQTVLELNRLGLRSTIAELVVKGYKPKQISAYLAQECGVDVRPQLIGWMIPRGDRAAMLAQSDILMRRRLKEAAIEEMEHLKAGYRAAEVADDKDAREHYARMWQSWWDRVGKFYLPQDAAPGGAQINILIADPKVLVREEVRNADDAARILARLESTETQRQSDQGVKRAEDAARPEEAAEPK